MSKRKNELKEYKKIKEEPKKSGEGLLGWRCPVCGRGNSPFNSTCPCVSTPIAPWPAPYVSPYVPSYPWYEQPWGDRPIYRNTNT